MLDHRLQHRERARLEVRAQVFDGPGERRRTRESAPRENAADFVFRIRGRLYPPEQLQHVPIVDESKAVALIAAAARPSLFAVEVERPSQNQPMHAAACRGELAAALD